MSLPLTLLVGDINFRVRRLFEACEIVVIFRCGEDSGIRLRGRRSDLGTGVECLLPQCRSLTWFRGSFAFVGALLLDEDRLRERGHGGGQGVNGGSEPTRVHEVAMVRLVNAQ